MRGLPLLGSFFEFRRNTLNAMMAGFQRHGDLVRYRLGPLTVYAVSSPELAGELLSDDGRFGKLGEDSPLRLVLGNGLLTSSDRMTWLRNRRVMQPIYTKQSVARFADIMIASTDEWLDRLAWRYPPGANIDIHYELTRVTLDVVSRCLFGADILDEVEAMGPNAIDVAVNFAFRRLLQNPLSPPLHWPTLGNRRFHRVVGAMDAMIYRLIADRRANGPRGGDLLDILLACRDRDTGEGMSDVELRDEVITAFSAGHETTAVALSWTFYLLSRHPEKLRRLLDEVEAQLGSRPPTLADLPNLPYTLQVFEETMRLYPPAPILPRYVHVDTTIGGYRVNEGSWALANLFNVQRHPAHWPDPHRFEPDRFEPVGRRAWHRYAYLPFGGGMHLCIGKHFALLEAHLLLAALVQRFNLRLVDSHRVEMHATLTMRPRYGMQMIIHPRQ
ncbi:MAG TPA: cytochrome P450 [Micromonosporaceae bacterium]|nr:cytochrome P450 [Micromonosporaceae bacterium]